MPLGGIGLVIVQAVLVLAYLAAGVTTLLKAKWASLVVGLVTPVWLVAAVRLARPSSWWARRFYDEAKLDRARARAASPRYRAVVAAGLIISLAAVGALFGLFKAYRIPSASMEPTLRCPRPEPLCSAEHADRVLVLRDALGRDPGRGALVAYRSTPEQAATCGAGGTFIHRVVGLPGERVSQEGGRILVDGEPLEEPYLPADASSPPFAPTVLPDDRYFVLGDNRQHACDSGAWGPLPRENIIGEVVFVYWPIDRIGTR